MSARSGSLASERRDLRSLIESRPIVVGAMALPEPWHVDMLGLLGYDFVWLDAEHGTVSQAEIEVLTLIAAGRGVPALVRVPSGDPQMAQKALESGATGIMIPMCQTADEVRGFISAISFHPRGQRGYFGLGADADYGISNTKEYLQAAGHATFIVVQIESAAAVENAGAIAAVPGVDMLFIGPADLSVSIGQAPGASSADLDTMIRRVAAAATTAGLPWGTVANTGAVAATMSEMGASLLCHSSPRRIIVNAYSARVREFRNAAPEWKA